MFYEYLGSCLKQFICLKTLTIDILEQYSDPHGDPGDCSVMLDRLGDLREKIETINLLVAHPRSDLQYMDFVYPVSTMTAFSGLKQLTMPCEWIEQIDNETVITTEFSQVFPQTLEMLELQIPEKHTCEWLLEFAKQRSTSNFRRLREFRLYCSERRGLSYETFLYDSRYAKQVENIADTGILIEVSYDPTEYKSYWGNKDYDPMSKIMADELRSLTVIYRHGQYLQSLCCYIPTNTRQKRSLLWLGWMTTLDVSSGLFRLSKHTPSYRLDG
ncbi:hypothetical protein SLS60_005433 [Paraconiothyrium brasiliense]|uniref:Uncharacterized protein n=1 Tax=Paraconiothyrium brasiliense TaxID=300254 RepID=A0ABR3RHE0_9PLEO